MERVVVQTLAYFQDHWAEKMTLQELAQRWGIPVAYLIKRFKAVTGQTPYQTLLGLRIAKAQELLRTTALTCSEIAQVTGFCDASFFGLTFARKVGMTPQAYRRQVQAVPPADLFPVVQALWDQVAPEVQRALVETLLAAARQSRSMPPDEPL